MFKNLNSFSRIPKLSLVVMLAFLPSLIHNQKVKESEPWFWWAEIWRWKTRKPNFDLNWKKNLIATKKKSWVNIMVPHVKFLTKVGKNDPLDQCFSTFFIYADKQKWQNLFKQIIKFKNLLRQIFIEIRTNFLGICLKSFLKWFEYLLYLTGACK